MLCKVKDDLFYDTNLLYTNDTPQNTSGWTTPATFISYEVPESWDYRFAITWHNQSSQYQGAYEFYYSDNTATSGLLWSIRLLSTTDDTYYLTLNLTAWKTLLIRWQWAGSQSTNKVYFTRWEISSLKATVPQTNSATVFGCPISIKPLWDLWFAVIYGKTPDKNYKGGIILWESTTATSWEIALWNAVWFITVNFNGEIIKIPYYWD